MCASLTSNTNGRSCLQGNYSICTVMTLNCSRKKICRANKPCNEKRRRRTIDVLRSSNLLNMTLAHDRNAITHGECFALVVCYENETDAHLALNSLQLDLHCFAQLQVECSQWFVKQQRTWVIHQRASQCNTLLLSTRKLRRFAFCKIIQANNFEHLHNACFNF